MLNCTSVFWFINCAVRISDCMDFNESVINTTERTVNCEPSHDATYIQLPFLLLSAKNIPFTASFEKDHKSLLDIGPEALHRNLLVSSAFCPTNDFSMWCQKQRLNFDIVTFLADCQIAYYLNMFA